MSSAECKPDGHRFAEQGCRAWFSPIRLLVDTPAPYCLTSMSPANLIQLTALEAVAIEVHGITAPRLDGLRLG